MSISRTARITRNWIGVLVLIGSSAVEQCRGGETGLFPAVSLVEKAKPLCSVLALDNSPGTGKVAYVLFDGNDDMGYRRAYVYIPQHNRFGTPQLMNTIDGTNFPSFSYSGSTPGSNGEDTVAVEWRVASSRQVVVIPPQPAQPAKPAGTAVVHDYITGQDKTVATPATPATPAKPGSASTNLSYGFTVEYGMMNNKTGPRLDGGKLPVEVKISGALPVTVPWSNALPTSGLAPWKSLRLAASHTVVNDTAKKKVGIQVKGGVYYGGAPCKFEAAPRAHEYVLSVNPYMDPPIYCSTQTVEQLLNGTTAEVKTGWYTWTAELRCPGLVIAPSSCGLFPLPPTLEEKPVAK